MLRNALTAVWLRFWIWGLVEILRYILGQGFEAEIWSRFWSWMLVEMLTLDWSLILVKSSKLKFDRDFVADFWLSFRGLGLVKILKLKLDILVIRLKSNDFGESTDPWLCGAFHISVCAHSVKHYHISQWMLPLKHGFGSKQNNPKISPPKDRQCWRFHFRSPQTPKLDQKNNQHTLPKSFKKFQWNFQFQVMPPHYFNQMFLSTKKFLIWKPQQKYHRKWR